MSSASASVDATITHKTYMTDDNQRSRLTRRTEEHAVSLWYTYNQHFAAANSYRYVSNGIDFVTIGLGGILTYSLIWKVLPIRTMAIFAVLTAILTGIRAAIRPENEKSDSDSRRGNITGFSMKHGTS
jgi:hypothetical protein